MDVDDDDISITSTAPSDFEAEYEVKTILDERQTEYGVRYLVWWEGYPLERSTWEPKDSFNDPQTFTDWEKKKNQIEAGKRRPFDLEKFEQHKAKVESERLERKRRRAAKRKRLGIKNPDAPQIEPLATFSPSSNPHKPVATSQRRPSQENLPLTGRVKSVADKPHMVGFGSSNASPAVPRSKAPAEKESSVRFKLLSTQYKHNKAMTKERAPNFSQLDLRRPSEWASRDTNAATLGRYFTSPSKGGETPQAPNESNDTHHSADNVGSGAVGQSSPKPSERVEIGIPPPNHQPQALRQERPEHGDLSIRGLADRALADHALGANQNIGKADLKSGYSQPKDSKAKEMPRLPSRRPRVGCFTTGPVAGSRFWHYGELLVHMFYGPEKKEIGSARICGLPAPEKNMLLAGKRRTRFDLWFQHICTFDEYRILCDNTYNNKKRGNGWVEGFDDTEPLIYSLGEGLKSKGLVAVCYPDGDESQLALLAYSPDSSMFNFLGESQSTEPSFLTIAVRSALASIEKLGYVPTERLSPPRAMSSPPAPPEPPAPPAPPAQSPGGDGKVDAHALFKETFGVSFPELASVQSNEGRVLVNIFYLMFPLDTVLHQKECEIFMAFLKNGRDPVIFSNRDPGNWHQFIGTSNNGVVIFHESFTDYHTLRDLSKNALCHRSFNFWNVSLVKPLDHVDRPLHLQRIFPFGGVILLTEDFMISDPKGAAIILAWFNEWEKRQFKGHWKLMLRPDALNWLVKRHNLETVKEKAGYWLGMYRSVMEANTPDPDFEFADYDISNVNSNLESPPVISPNSLANYGTRKEDEHPDIPKGLTQEQRNADHLVEFFAGWGLVNCDKFRRFVVVTGVKPEQRWLSWNHLELYHGPKDFMKAFKVDFVKYLDKVKNNSKPPSTGSTSRPHDPKSQQTGASITTSNANSDTLPDLNIPWRGPSQIRPMDSRRPGDTNSPRDAYSPREPFSPRDGFSPRDSRPPRSGRPRGSWPAPGGDCYRPGDAHRSREPSPQSGTRTPREFSPPRGPRNHRDAPAQRSSKFKGNSYYPQPYR